jgi:hypothetical protein
MLQGNRLASGAGDSEDFVTLPGFFENVIVTAVSWFRHQTDSAFVLLSSFRSESGVSINVGYFQSGSRTQAGGRTLESA